MTKPKHVTVVGAGLAGLSSAIHLLEYGFIPTVIESQPYVGGRTASWNERGMDVESGLHRFLGFYTHVPNLLQKAGIELNDILFWEDEVEIRMPDGPWATFGLSPLHKPLRTLWRVMGNNKFLTPKDKILLEKFFIAGIRDYIKRPEELEKITVLQYAKSQGLSKNAMDRALIPLTEGIFFLPMASYSTYALFGLVVPYLKTFYKLRVGAFKGGMTEVMAKPLAAYIEKSGGRVIPSQPVRHIAKAGETFTISTTTHRYRADAVVLATSLKPAQQIIKNSFTNKWFDKMLKLQTMPSVTFQIELNQPSLDIDRTTFGPLTSMAAFSEQSRTTFRGSKGRLSIILSPPDRYIDMKAADILDHVITDAASLGISLKDKIIDYRKVVIPHDFYLLSPGSEPLRPFQKTAIPGFYLAGDYTKQKYLATMEGAVYSGKRAAKMANDYLGKQLL